MRSKRCFRWTGHTLDVGFLPLDKLDLEAGWRKTQDEAFDAAREIEGKIFRNRIEGLKEGMRLQRQEYLHRLGRIRKARKELKNDN